MTDYTAVPITPEPYALGEGVIWDENSGKLWWVDVLAGDLWSGHFDGTSLTRPSAVHIDETVGCVVPAADGGVVVAGTRRLFVLPADGRLRGSTRLPIPGQYRLNDGACDPRGRLVVGTACLTGPQRGNQLFQIEATGRSRRLRSGIGLANGLAWSIDQSTLYFVDSNPGTIWRCDYDVARGGACRWSPLFHVEDGTPDGMAVDSAGHLWIAIWGMGEVRRYSVTGEVLSVVHVDASHTSSVTFAGPELQSLVISTARHGLSRQDLAQHPHSGRLFHAEVGATGVPIHRWCGRTDPLLPNRL